MDKIYLKDFEVFANHGVFEEEKKLGQKFIIDVEAKLDLREAGKTDDLTKSVSYADLCLGVENVFTEESLNLIEAAAEKVANYILITYPLIKEVKVRVKKPWAPIGKHLDYAAVEIERKWHEAYLSIGSNLGDKEENLNTAVSILKDKEDIVVEKVSSYIVTEPWGKLDQPEFVNGAVKLKTLLTPEELVDCLLSIESEMKRVREVKWGPRIIDLDIIFYDNLVTESDKVTIPHPRMEEREFVLKPLMEIAPNKIHPVLKKRVLKILEEMQNN